MFSCGLLPFCPDLASGDKVRRFREFLTDDSGATAIEYGLLASLIAVVIIAAVKAVGTNLSTMFTSVANNLT